MAARCYYSVLGVSRDASPDEIRKAYKRMALNNHPDKNGHSDEAHKRFHEISEAYQVLNDPVKRKHYDKFGFDTPRCSQSTRRNHTNSRSPFERDEFFDSFFDDSYIFRDPMEIFNEVFNNQMRGIRDLFNFASSRSGGFFGSAFDDIDDECFANPNTKSFIQRSSASYNSQDPEGFVMKSESRKYVNGHCYTQKKSVKNGVETVIMEEDGRVVSKSINDAPRRSKQKTITGY